MQAGSHRRASATIHGIGLRHRHGRRVAHAAPGRQAARPPSQPLLRPLALSLLLALSGPAAAVDYFWVNSFGGAWNEQFSWKDAAGNTGIPGAGDNAYLVLPYQLANCFGGTCMTQPVPVTYRSATNPPLNRLVINSDNYLTQPAFGTPGQLDLTSNYQVIGSGESFTPPPGVFFPNPPGIYPRGLHLQYDGTNTVKTELVIGSVQMTFDTIPANAIEGGYRLDGGTLTVGDPVLGTSGIEKIGRAGDGAFVQTGGTHLVHGTLIMAEQAGSSGTLDLRGGSLQAGGQVISSAGRAEVRHVGGSNSVGTFILGLSPGGEGTYQLSSGGTLSIGRDAVIGAAGKGTFQNFSNNSIAISGNLTVGRDAGSQGSFATTAGLTVGGNLIIGEAGTGTFSQGAGSSVSIGGDLRMGRAPIEGASGSYSLRNGTLAVSGRAVFGAFPLNASGTPASGSFDQSGGSVVVQGDLDLRNGSYRLTDGGELRVAPNVADPRLMAPMLTVGGRFEHLGGKVSVGNAEFAEANFMLVVGGGTGGSASYSLQDGQLTVYGSVLLGSESDPSAARGSFVQSRGTLDIGARRAIGPVGFLLPGSLELWNGDFTLSNGEVIVRATQGIHPDLDVSAYQGGAIEVSGTSTFTQSAGSVKASAINVRSLATYTLSHGSVNVEWVYFPYSPGSPGADPPIPESPAAFVGGTTSVDGAFHQSGGELIGRRLFVEVDGRYQMREGLLQMVDTFDGVSGDQPGIENQGRFDWSGGEIFVRREGGSGTGTWDNDERQSLLNVTGGGIRELHANLSNSGTVTITDTTLRVTGDYTGSGTVEESGGALILDPSTVVVVGDVTLEPGAYFVGDAGSVFQMGADFINRSVNKADWNTAEATVLFDGEGAVAHAFYLPGMDRGASEAGFVDNFAWGVLGLAADDSLVLLDGNDTPGAALYVGVIAEGTDLDSISSPYNIYYDPALAGNSWLGGARMALDGGGFLAPVPEPRSALLLSLGVLMLAGLRRRWRSH